MKKLPMFIPRLYKIRPKRPEPGALPGTLVPHTGLLPPVITRIEYGPDKFESSDVAPGDLESALKPSPGNVVWINFDSVGDEKTILRAGAALDLHALTMEDIVHVHQRPKVEKFENHLFVTLRAIRPKGNRQIDNEQVSFILKKNLLITFQERPGDSFDPVRKRIRDAKGPIRTGGADYLFYALFDTTIDSYFPVLELYEDSLEQLDEQIRARPTAGLSHMVHTLRFELRHFRKAVWPLRDIAGMLSRNEVSHIDSGLQPSFRDCYDHVISVAEFIEGSRERASDIADLFQTMISEKTNQVIKTLTIVATIFIPLTFLCGLYGMNFDPEVSPYNMPELKWRFGYIAFWGVILAAFFGMIIFFRLKGWLGGNSEFEDKSQNRQQS